MPRVIENNAARELASAGASPNKMPASLEMASTLREDADVRTHIEKFSGRAMNALYAVKTARLTPIPSARARIDTIVKLGLQRECSCQALSLTS